MNVCFVHFMFLFSFLFFLIARLKRLAGLRHYQPLRPIVCCPLVVQFHYYFCVRGQRQRFNVQCFSFLTCMALQVQVRRTPFGLLNEPLDVENWNSSRRLWPKVASHLNPWLVAHWKTTAAIPEEWTLKQNHRKVVEHTQCCAPLEFLKMCDVVLRLTRVEDVAQLPCSTPQFERLERSLLFVLTIQPQTSFIFFSSALRTNLAALLDSMCAAASCRPNCITVVCMFVCFLICCV